MKSEGRRVKSEGRRLNNEVQRLKKGGREEELTFSSPRAVRLSLDQLVKGQ